MTTFSAGPSSAITTEKFFRPCSAAMSGNVVNRLITMAVENLQMLLCQAHQRKPSSRRFIASLGKTKAAKCQQKEEQICPQPASLCPGAEAKKAQKKAWPRFRFLAEGS